ncbi:MAG TPA: hypothetical protein VN175_02000 [Rhizomicrobium sp.]|nr:hypothetical protein [Rhizomicrobium sp.]
MARKTLILAVFLGFPALLPALAQEPAISAHPDGTGDPDATTCRPAQPLPNSHFSGPRVCKLNSQWALLRKNGQDISADGRDIIPDPKGANVGPMNCTYSGGGATSSGQMICRPQ